MTIRSGFFLSKAGATVFFTDFTSTIWVAAVGASLVGLMVIREDGRCEEYGKKYFVGYCKQIRTRTLILPSAIPFGTDWLQSRPNAVSVMILSICPTPLGKLPVNDSRAVLKNATRFGVGFVPDIGLRDYFDSLAVTIDRS
jgi:hypothetical protein